MGKGARNRSIRLAEQGVPKKDPPERRRAYNGMDGYKEFWDEQAKIRLSRPGRSGSEKRRARKGGARRGPGKKGSRVGTRSRRGYVVHRG